MATTAEELFRSTKPPVAHGFGATDVMLLLMATIWGVNYSVIKYASRIFTPLVFNGIRIPIAAAAQLAAGSVAGEASIARPDKWRLILLGALGNGVYQLLFILGIARTQVATAALLMAATPALIAILGWLHGSERVSPGAWAGIALQLAGMSSVVMGSAGARQGADSLNGVALVLAAALSWAAYSILIRPYAHRVPPLQMGGYTMLGGAIVAVAAAVPMINQAHWDQVTPRVWLAMSYSAIGALVIAYLFWYRGVRVLGPTRTSMYGNLQPLIAMLVAWLALGERPTVWQIAG
ncbi:MAG: DMT family transporter, partial [Gemmatimonadaceae bacterium]